MTSHAETQTSPYTPRQLFDLVADVEAYPQFLPWCSAARILERHGELLIAELVIGFKGFTGSYVSRVALDPPSSIEVTLVRGPFSRLSNTWKFLTLPQGGTRIDFTLDFEFRSGLLNLMIGPLFARACTKMVDAFKTRADALYGKKS